VVVPKGYIPPIGSEVTFTIAKLRSKETLLATSVSAAPRGGIVDRLVNAQKAVIYANDPVNTPPSDPAPPAAEPDQAPTADPKDPKDPKDSPQAAAAAPAAADEGAAAEGAGMGAAAAAMGAAIAAAKGSGSTSGTTSPVHHVICYLNELGADVELATGDEVDFVLGVNTKSGELVARNLHVTKSAPKAANRTEWVRRENACLSMPRYASGPDGTRGFSLGRGKRVSPSAPVEAI